MTLSKADLSLAAIILTYNTGKVVDACLKSIAGWCPEIFVVDSGSTDDTLDICRQYTSRIYFNPFVSHPAQWDWALHNLPLTREWILPLDSDHIVSPELRREIIEVVRHPDPTINGYYARHQYFFWGVPMRGFKSYSLRLFRLKKTSLDHGDLLEQRFVIAGKTRNLAGAVYEVNHDEWDIDFWVDKHQKYATRLAIQEVLSDAGEIHRFTSPSLGGNPDERIIWAKNLWEKMPLLLRPFLYFFYRYVFRLGFLDGKIGFVYHFLQAFWFRLMVDVKIMDLRRKLAQGEITLPELKAAYLENR